MDCIATAYMYNEDMKTFVTQNFSKWVRVAQIIISGEEYLLTFKIKKFSVLEVSKTKLNYNDLRVLALKVLKTTEKRCSYSACII